jgi:7-cyano-7-deazaguanine synthase
VVVLASGGLDSCALIAHNLRKGRDVFPLFIRCGLRWEPAELAALKRWLRALRKKRGRGKRRPGVGRLMPLTVLSLPADDLYGRHWSTVGKKPPGWRAADNSVYLPGRNILLLSKAAVFAAMRGIPRIATGQLRGNTFPDATPAFFRLFARGLSAGLDFRIQIEAPFLRTEKPALIARYRELPLHLTLSCSAPRGGTPCGRCAKCRERVLAFRMAGLPDGLGP